MDGTMDQVDRVANASTGAIRVRRRTFAGKAKPSCSKISHVNRRVRTDLVNRSKHESHRPRTRPRRCWQPRHDGVIRFIKSTQGTGWKALFLPSCSVAVTSRSETLGGTGQLYIESRNNSIPRKSSIANETPAPSTT